MALPVTLIKYIEGQIAAGPTPDALRNIVRRAVSEWNVSAASVALYLMQRFQSDTILQEQLRLGFIDSASAQDVPRLSAEADAALRAELGLKPRPAPLPPQPDFSAVIVGAQWDMLGPFVSEAAWQSRHYEQLCQDTTQPGELRYWARKCWLEWRVVERVLLLEETALLELDEMARTRGLEPEVTEYLAEYHQRSTRLLDRLSHLPAVATQKVPVRHG